MTTYHAPLKDMRFVLLDVLKGMTHYAQFPEASELTPDLLDSILEECARFCEQELAPLNQSGDHEGCRLENGEVKTPKGFRQAYQRYMAAGWQGLAFPVEYGGQGLPLSLSVLRSEMVATANWSFGMYPGLSLGAMNTLFLHGSDEQKNRFLPRLTSGAWAGTMCLTEPQCGTDLGQIRTRAEAMADGRYRLTGTKIFISSGDHDLTDNIIHIVLARLPDAPSGTRGISLFVVPKRDIDTGKINGVSVGGLEEKMGIKASATCVLNFDGAMGELIGPPNGGLACMFTFMNTARIGTGLQGIAAAELAYQNSLNYARDRLSMRSLSGKKAPDKAADPILVHPDVRRMLMTQRAFAEGGRCLVYMAAMMADDFVLSPSASSKARTEEDLGFLTPIVKGFLTEAGLEAANLGMQVFGGHGYIKDWGMEQLVRDTRIATLYEGTTGIQALDLLGRKVLLEKGASFRRLQRKIAAYCGGKSAWVSGQHRQALKPMIRQLTWQNRQWAWLTLRLLTRALRNRDEVGAAAYDYLMYSGYTVLAWSWALMAEAAAEKKAAGGDALDHDFLDGKIATAKFYFERLLPRAKGHYETILGGSDSLMAITDAQMAAR